MDKQDDSASRAQSIVCGVPAIVAVMAALEEWLARDGDERRIVFIEHIPNRLAPWFATVTLGKRHTAHPGMTMADALAQAAQVVVSDPTIGGAS